MSDLVYRNYLFSIQEFMVLCAGNGIEQIPVLYENRPAEINRKELSLIVFQLYKNGILNWNSDNSYSLKPDLQTVFREIRTSEKILQIYSEFAAFPILCFWNLSAIVLELSANDHDVIKLRTENKKVFLKELCERSILPEKTLQESVDSEEESCAACRVFLQDMPEVVTEHGIQYETLNRVLHECDMLTGFITVCDGQGQGEQAVILILGCGMQDFLVFIRTDSVEVCDYTLENLNRFLNL